MRFLKKMSFIFEKLILKILINFIISQVDKFREEFDWDKFKVNLDSKVRDWVPGSWFDDTAVDFVERVFGSFRKVLEETDEIKSVIKHVADKEFAPAYDLIKDLFEKDLGEDLVYLSSDVKMKELSSKI